MKHTIHLAIGGLLLMLFGTWIYRAQLGVSSTTFCGPEFHARNSDECSTVYAAFSHHLEEIGYKGSVSPSEFDSWAGLHSEGASRIWFEKSESNNQKTYVYVDLEKTVVRTSIKWEVFGTHRKAQIARLGAYKLAVALDDWFLARKELNEVPRKFKDGKRQGFIENLAKNQAS